MTEDVAHYVSLAREADGPIVELMVGSGRVAIEVVRETGKPVLGIDSSPAMLEIARERSAGLAARAALRRRARARARRARGADLRPVPLAPPPARLGGEAAGVRARRRLAAAGRALRLQRLRLQPHDRGAARRHRRRTRAAIVHTLRYVPADNRIEIVSGTTPRRSGSGGPPSPSGTASSRSPGSRSRRSTAASTGEPFDDESLEFVYVTRKP